MRTMTRNRKVFYSASFDGLSMSTDKDGNYVEEKHTYSDPVKRYGVFTPANGNAHVQLFGMNELYDKVIMLNGNDDYLAVGSVLWVDTMPVIDEHGKTETPHDYIVVRVAKSLNFIRVAIRKVNVS